ncbi:hypothetical protein I862_01375 [endosymbiont of Acanthamoeba sp. UWC8]|uniref:hypothetical protein n=1 Tax=endosymbiont of Acanthamoeba sp. UWC8 TaxID=86106 RepID=UPI0004D1A1B0|nr:hypothetical protein [endosymbiont of Acanthamoeba sp. UWC8]AIF80838.1 hypothetical protein I862_01375 [endosymbiont of Acanthamoeba sp. UWC8]
MADKKPGFGELKKKYELGDNPSDTILQKAGNGVYAGFNNLGAALNTVCSAASTGMQKINEWASMPLRITRENFTESKSFSRKSLWGVAIAASTALKAVGGLFGIGAASTEAAGHLVHETCILSGAAGRTILRPNELDSYKIAGAALTRVGGEFVMNVTAPIKQLGTEVKDIGDEVKIPLLTQGLRLLGGAVQSFTQMTEGAAQGFRKMAVGDLKEGGKIVGAGALAAGNTVLKDVVSVAGDVKRDVMGDKRKDPENSTNKNADEFQKNSRPQDAKKFDEMLEKARNDGKVELTKKDDKPKEKGEGKPVVGEKTANLKAERSSQNNNIGLG